MISDEAQERLRKSKVRWFLYLIFALEVAVIVAVGIRQITLGHP